MAGCARGVPKLARRTPSFYTGPPPNLATALNIRDLARKMVQILCFSAPVRFRGHFEEIAIAKVLLNTKSRRVRKFRGCRFSDV